MEAASQIDRLGSLIAPEKRDEAIREFAADMTAPRYVWRNGPIEIVSYAQQKMPTHVTALMADIDHLMGIDPKKSMRVAIDGPALARESPDTHGLSFRSDSFISLRSSAVQTDRNDLASMGYSFMPSGTGGVPGRTYYLTHEWGHSVDEVPWEWLDEGENPGIYKDTPLWYLYKRRDIPAGSLSPYGLTKPEEGYAEAYAEWILSKGYPLNKDGTYNGFVAALAEQMGWPQI